jgi:hypothetical protein
LPPPITRPDVSGTLASWWAHRFRFRLPWSSNRPFFFFFWSYTSTNLMLQKEECQKEIRRSRYNWQLSLKRRQWSTEIYWTSILQLLLFVDVEIENNKLFEEYIMWLCCVGCVLYVFAHCCYAILHHRLNTTSQRRSRLHFCSLRDDKDNDNIRTFEKTEEKQLHTHAYLHLRL